MDVDNFEDWDELGLGQIPQQPPFFSYHLQAAPMAVEAVYASMPQQMIATPETMMESISGCQGIQSATISSDYFSSLLGQSEISDDGEFVSSEFPAGDVRRLIDSSLGLLEGPQIPPRHPLQWAAEGLRTSPSDTLRQLSIADQAIRTFWGPFFHNHTFQRQSLPTQGESDSPSDRSSFGKRSADSDLDYPRPRKKPAIQNKLAQKAYREHQMKKKEKIQRQLLAERGRCDDLLPKAPEPEILAYKTPEIPATSLSSTNDLYDKLPNDHSIRTLCIEPGVDDDKLSCYLVTTDLSSQAVDYEAISYAWGDTYQRSQISCNGRSLSITSNLKDALLSFRYADTHRYVWADAVCINQSDVRERNHQVRLMRKIFMSASKVLVWLGKDITGDAITAFSVLTGVVRGPRTRTENEWSAHFYSNGISSNLIPNLPDSEAPPPESPHWTAVVKLFSAQWFWRLWCIQEVALAKFTTLKWGAAEMSWDWVGHAAALIRTNEYQVLRQWRMPGVFNAYFMYRISQGDSDFAPLSMNFFRLMSLTRQFESSEPRDRIYSLLGIPTTDSKPDKGVLFVQPDYSRDIDAIYWDLALNFLEADSDYQLFSSIQHGPTLPEDDSLPSWVPRWDKVFTHSLLPSTPGVSHKAGKGMPINRRTRYHMDAMTCLGVKISTVSHIYNSFSSSRDSFLDFSAAANAIPNFNWHSLLKTAESRKRLALTLTAGKDWYGKAVSNTSQHLADFAAWLTPALQPASKYSDLLRQASDGDLHRFAAAMSNVCAGRRLFFTSNGYMGLGPECLQQADILVVLFGGIVPFLLRSYKPPIADRYPCRGPEIEGYWKLVGDCYVHDLMSGQAMDMVLEGKLEARDFEIK